jgi:predicted dehydrogenase
MIDVCRKKGVKLAGLFPYRANKTFNLIKEALAKKRFGRLTVCNAFIPWHRTQQYYDSGGWRGTWKLDGGGALMNQSIHTMDLLQWLAGMPKEVHAYAGNLAHKRIEVEDTAVATLKFKSGALGVLVGSTAMWPGYEVGLQISGENGSAWVGGETLTKWEFARGTPRDKKIRKAARAALAAASKGGASDPRDISFSGHQAQCQNMVNCLKGKEELMVDGKEARKAVEFILAVYDSALCGKAVKLPLKRTPKLRKFRKP